MLSRRQLCNLSKQHVAWMSSSKHVVGFGEAMIRYQADKPTFAPVNCLRSVGGDELNVCVDLAKLDVNTHWVSALPEGALGDLVYDCGVDAGVNMEHVSRCGGDAEVGTFTVLPELGRVHFQRKNSVFAHHDPDSLDWDRILKKNGETWLHATGITPMVAASPLESWKRSINCALENNIPVSMDFNHRPQLGPLEGLWALVRPLLPRMEILVLSARNVVDLAAMEGIPAPSVDTNHESEEWIETMSKLRERTDSKAISVCFKKRFDDGVQRRFSVVVTRDAEGGSKAFSTVDTPVMHSPKDECGGGSAWFSGYVDGLFCNPCSTTNEILRRADLLAAMCQETRGDHSVVTRTELAREEARFHRRTATVPAASANPSATLDDTVNKLNNSGIIAILRATGNADAAIQRGVELASMGCRALEITLDSQDWQRVLRELSSQLPDVCVGVGTVMDDTVTEVPRIASLGGRFALSPIAPMDFISACHSRGVVAVPSALSSNECWDLHCQGARAIKVFHAGMVGPGVLKSMLGVTPLAAMNLMPSGGVSPDNVEEWWDAGAKAVGMGSNLVGSEISYPSGTPEHEAAVRAWENGGRAIATEMFAKVQQRFPL